MKKIIFLVFIFGGIISLEAFKLSGKRWSGLHPVIQIEVDFDFQGLKTHQGMTLFLNDILLAAREWNNKSRTHLNWKVSTVAVPNTKSYFNLGKVETIATETNKTFCDVAKSQTGKLPIVISSEKSVDGDCTGNSCVFVWSCDDEIVHADVSLNNSDFSWAELVSDQDVFNLKAETLKAFGQLAGLTSCNPGDKESDCSISGDPSPDSALYKFPDFGKKEIIASDDISGIQTLYGNFKLPFPDTGQYALNEQERIIVQDLLSLEYQMGYSNPVGRAQIAKQVNHLAKYSEYRSKKDLRTQYDELMRIMQKQTPTLSPDGIRLQKDLLLMGIVTAVRTREDAVNGYTSMDIAFIDYTIQRHMDLWRMTIDRIGGR